MCEPIAWTPDTLPWGEPAPDGVCRAPLEGNAAQDGGAVIFAVKIPRGAWSKPHAHNQDVRVFVVSGVYRLGYGAEFTSDIARAYPAGSYLLVLATIRHFDGADEDAVVFVSTGGPIETHAATG
ncbi:MAG TPA: cupin domain-containing protein [Acidisphaera sp.]|nr:cupin domain-containing protein [Acidisphaera sp.]